MNQKNVLLAVLITFFLLSCDGPYSPYYIKGVESASSHESLTFEGKTQGSKSRTAMWAMCAYDFQYYIPGDKQLIVTMKAELNGEILPRLSGHYHISPPGHPMERNKGRISIKYYEPPGQQNQYTGAKWDYNFSRPQVGHGYGNTSPITFSEITGGFERSSSIVAKKNPKPDQEYKVWNFSVDWNSEQGKKKHSNFSLTMSIRITSFDENTFGSAIFRKDFR